MVSPARLCIQCKGGRALCGHSPCPLLARLKIAPKISKNVSTEFFGPSPSIFVGHVGYPHINIGPLAAIEFKQNINSPTTWFDLSYSDVIELRSLLLRSKFKQHIKTKSRLVSEVQELALAEKPTEIELVFKKKPIYSMSFSDIHQPMGPSAILERLRLTENPKISKKVEYIITDDLTAAEAASALYHKGQDVYKITTVLSSGTLGLEERQKLVPTRWSITATDDIIAKHLLAEIRQFPTIGEFQVFSGQYLDNHFEILLMPGNWEYEGFEAWAPGSFWSQQLKEAQIIQEHETFRGRTKYAEGQGGGYYAARIGVVEVLHKMKKQARVVVFREVYEGYTIPLGVWVVRENVRRAMSISPKKFVSQQDALNYIASKLRLPIKKYIEKSTVLKQKRLLDFF